MASENTAAINKQANAASDTDRKSDKSYYTGTLRWSMLGVVGVGMLLWYGTIPLFTDNHTPENQPPATVAPPAGITHSGTITAPVGQWSQWLHALANQCLYWQGEDPTGNRFRVQYTDSNGNIREYDGTPLQTARSVRFKSKTGNEERVIYELTRKVNGRCS